MHAINPSPSSARDEIIDVEYVVRDAGEPEHLPPREPLRLQLPAGPAAPSKSRQLFELPPELDPRRLLETQRKLLADMIHVLEHGPPPPDPDAPPPPPPETPEQFLDRSMALLDRHIESLEASLEKIVGRQWMERKP
jgi:hypothetical protein